MFDHLPVLVVDDWNELSDEVKVSRISLTRPKVS